MAIETFSVSSDTDFISDDACRAVVDRLIERLRADRKLSRVLLIPPDFTRFHSQAGFFTADLYAKLRSSALVKVLPALGTHFPMEQHERETMFPGIPPEDFLDHNWRTDVVTLGEIPASEYSELSEGRDALPVAVQVNKLLTEQPWDAIISIGQLVPHEVIGIANHIKNVLVGVGGFDMINKSHWLGAIYGMERIMGQVQTPVRELMNRAATRYLGRLPLIYLMTVRNKMGGQLVTRGVYYGEGTAPYDQGAPFCRQMNLDFLPRPMRKAVVYLDPHEFKSTWLGNKAVYRTRMAIADDGELVILAPGVKQFGEDGTIDKLIRQYGYRGTPATIAAVRERPELAANLSAAAHLIHGSSEGRFRIRYCPGHLSEAEIRGVGYEYGDLAEMSSRYNPERLSPGWNEVNGEEVFYVSNPALGLWCAER